MTILDKGVYVWIQDGDVWHRAVVVHLGTETSDREHAARLRFVEGPHANDERLITVNMRALENEEQTDLLLANNSDMDLVEDLIQLPHLHAPGICHTLLKRFEMNEIYTFTGEILLALNPFCNIGIYSEKIRRKYIRHGEKRASGADVMDMPPHVFSIADKAYRNLWDPIQGKCQTDSRNQSILVSGESGAGKTESTKFIMEYIATLSKLQKGKKLETEFSAIEKILSSNPILESFGNARTIRNDNSSRFGKFIKLHFSEFGQLVGASIKTYLLEKVRLTFQAESERNYHIFYELIAGATAEERKQWQLPSRTAYFHYLNQSSCNQRKDGVQDTAQLQSLRSAMEIIGFEAHEMHSIFHTVSMLLHVGNIKFEEIKDHVSGMQASRLAPLEERSSLSFVLQYFESDRDRMEQALCSRKIQAKDDTFAIHLSVEEAQNTRDAMARYVYGQLFHWLVTRINMRIFLGGTTTQELHFIGLLDIFGFEDLSHNSFEQLCINFANERLQQHFNRSVLRLEQDMYEREEIAWSFIDFPDNSSCIALIQDKPMGILSILDEECIIPQGNDCNFARKLYRQHAAHAHFAADHTQQANHCFLVRHYASPVVYDSFGFCDKNKDILYPEIISFIQKCSKPFVKELIKGADTSTEKATLLKLSSGSRTSSKANTSRVSLGTQFKLQLNDLLDTISATKCHYVRCLKPNDLAKPFEFVPKRVSDQLRAGGVLEAVRVNRAGYPVRLTHEQCITRYRLLAKGNCLRDIMKAHKNSDPMEYKRIAQELVQYLLHDLIGAEALSSDHVSEASLEIKVGRTRVFFRRAVIQYVEAQLAKQTAKSVIILQSHIRAFVYYQRFQKVRRACLSLQTLFRGRLARNQYCQLQEETQISLSPTRIDQSIRRSRQGSDPISESSSDENRATAREIVLQSSKRVHRFRFTRETDLSEQTTTSSLEERRRSVTMNPGDTVLHVAANCCNASDVLQLIQSGLDINALNRRNRTPLHGAALNGNVSAVGILLDYDADPCIQDADGNTALHLTTNPTVAHMLLQAGCTTDLINAEGRSALIEAVDRGSLEIVRYLLEYKADVLFRELKHHQTVLHLAVRKGHYAIVVELCKSEDAAKLISLTDRNENNALHFAVSRDRKNGYRLVDYLIKNGVHLDKINARFQSPLVIHIMTTRQMDPSIAELMLSKGADPNIQLADGSTLLHVAIERELIDTGCVLLKYGSHLNQADSLGRFVVEIVHRKFLKKLLSAITTPPTWIDAASRKECMHCNAVFKFGTRRHHCRHCGRVCCGDCTSLLVELQKFPKAFWNKNTMGKKGAKEMQRVCRTCFTVFKLRSMQKDSKSGFMARMLGYEWDDTAD